MQAFTQPHTTTSGHTAHSHAQKASYTMKGLHPESHARAMCACTHTHAPLHGQVHKRSLVICIQSVGPRAPWTLTSPLLQPGPRRTRLEIILQWHGEAPLERTPPFNSSPPPPGCEPLVQEEEGRVGFCSWRGRSHFQNLSPRHLSPLGFDTGPSQRAGPK